MDTTSLSKDEVEKLNLMRNWILNEKSFKGNTDDDFILMFLKGCKFDLDKTKSKMKRYYENRIKVPQWHFGIIIPEDPEVPVIGIYRLRQIGDCEFDDLLKYTAMLGELIIRSPNCQNSGVMSVVDAKDTPNWLKLKFMSPIIIKQIVSTSIHALPAKVHSIHILNVSYWMTIIWKALQKLLPEKISNRVQLYSSDSKMSSAFRPDLLPTEYGGQCGSLKCLADSTYENAMQFRQFFLDEKHYGFLNAKPLTT
ncbi:hypothetical protein CHUAL_002882 [Chamberlinius hualienensis]